MIDGRNDLRGRGRGIVRVALGALVVAGLAVTPSRAHAQASADAEQLFRDAKAQMKAGKIAEACAAFEASEKAEHNLATVLSLGDCREKNQQYASAWALFLQADSQTRSDASKGSMNLVAKKRAAALEPRLSYLTINVPDESRVEGLVVLRDDVPVDPGAWNRAIPVDGGEHLISGRAPGHEEWSTKIKVGAESDKQAVEVPKFKELPKLVNPPPDDHGGGGAVEEPSPFTPRRKIALGILAGGVAAAGVGIGFGISARGLRSDALATCPPNSCNQQNAVDANALNNTARKRSVVANVGLGVAGAAVIASAVLWYLSPPESPDAPADANSPSTPTSTSLQIVPVIGETNGLVLMRNF